MTRFVDTNVFIRYLTGDDEAKAKASLVLFQRLETGKESALTSDAVIAEVVFILQSPRLYQMGKERIRTLLEPIIWLRGLRLPNKSIYKRTFDLYCGTSIGFVDAYNAAYMESHGITEVYSYDKDFDKVTGITRLEP